MLKGQLVTQVALLCWQITSHSSAYCCGFWCDVWGAPTSQHCWLSQGVKVPRATSSPRATQRRDRASPSAAAATSLLNYINRPPSSVIFYYTGKKWAGQVKKSVFHFVNTSEWVSPTRWPRSISVERATEPSARLKLGVRRVFLRRFGTSIPKSQRKILLESVHTL